jgi:signal transduction histidine kinase/AraC-like DNA-binding protein
MCSTLLATSLLAQSKVDSLLRSLELLKEDSLKTEMYRTIGIELMRTDQAKALDYFSRAEELSLEKGLKSSLAKSKYRKGTVYRSMNLFQQSKEELDVALSIFIQLKDTFNILYVKVELATLLKGQSQFDEAIELYLEALTLIRITGDKNSEARIHNYIGGIYRTQKIYNKALEHYELALLLVKALDFKPGISACLTNLGGVYSSLKNYDKAVALLQEAIEVKKEIGDKLGAGRAQINLGIIFNDQKKYQQAEDYYQEAYNLAKQVNNPELLSLAEFGLAECSYYEGDFERCILLANELLEREENTMNLESTLKTHKLLASAYRENGEFQNALEHAMLQISLSDSLYNEQVISATNELEAKYQNEQKEKEIAFLSTEKNLQSLQLEKRVNERNAIIALAFIMLLMAGLLYNQYRVKQNANKKLQEVDRLKSNFFANISHEFRTPLTLIKGPIEQLELHPKEKLSRENIKMIRRNTDRVLTLVNQLLDLSKIDGGSLKLEVQEGEIFQFLRAVTSSFSSHAAQRNIGYNVQIPQPEFLTAFDRDKVEKVMNNLLSNAFKFSESGSLVSVDISCDRGGIKIQVTDNGKGIPKEKLPFIFDRFYQVDSTATKEKEGSGIGLSLTKNLVQLMNGTIEVSSDIGKGTVFTVHLPLVEIRSTAQERQEQSTINRPSIVSKIDSGAGLFHLEKADNRDLPEILLVEDNADMRQYIKEHLIDFYRVRESINGKAGLKNARANPPDLIITDWMMPKMNGMELCKKLKSDVHTSHIPVIMLTAKAGMDNKLEGLETGADDYLTKPFDGMELLVRTKNLIQQRQKLRELFSTKEVKLDPKKITVTSIDQKFLEKVLALLEKNFPDPDFGVPQMQDALAMSKTQLHRKLKALTNEAPGELLRNFRLKRAAQLLSQKADSVTQIAYKVGFNNLSYFAKCFKELYGVAPSAY